MRFVFRGINNTFANDIEPEYIAFNDDETKAFIALQVSVRTHTTKNSDREISD